MKKIFLALSLLLSALVLPLSAAHAEEATASPSLCAMAIGTPELDWKTDNSCNEAFCSEDQQCWTNCPEATSVACVSGICQYTLPGGGSGGGGICPEQRFCFDDSHCVYGSLQGTCSGGTCHC